MHKSFTMNNIPIWIGADYRSGARLKFFGEMPILCCRDVTTLALGSQKKPIGKPVDTYVQNPPHGKEAVQ